MKVTQACLPCFLDQVERTARFQGFDDEAIGRLKDEASLMLEDIRWDVTPAEIAPQIYGLIEKAAGVEDLYAEVKKNSIAQALKFYPYLKAQVEKAEDPLLMAVKIAAAGNMIDFGTTLDFDLERDLLPTLDAPFAIFDYQAFKRHLAGAEEILYLGDNAGESVFDRVLIETLPAKVTYAVRSRPIINDVLLEDALAAGIDQAAEIIASGTGCPGTVLHTCTPEFRQLYEQAVMVIAKGMGNLEALSEETRPVFFLLKVKCQSIADHIGAELGKLVLKGLNA